MLDLVSGQPVRDLPVLLEVRGAPRSWRPIGQGHTDKEGRLTNLYPGEQRIQPGAYRLTFDVERYARAQKRSTFYPEVSVVFAVENPSGHYHIPLLLGPFGYTTYRGS